MRPSKYRHHRHVLAWALAALAIGTFDSIALADNRPGSTAILTWEAPGDDGDTGIATRYQVRYRVTPLLDADTLTYWSAGTIVSGVPAPGLAGDTDSLVITGLDPSVTYWFIVRAADETPNWSGFSNIVEKPAVADRIPPADVQDLGTTSADARKPAKSDTARALPVPPRR